MTIAIFLSTEKDSAVYHTHKDWVQRLCGWQAARLFLGRFLVFLTPS